VERGTVGLLLGERRGGGEERRWERVGLPARRGGGGG